MFSSLGVYSMDSFWCFGVCLNSCFASYTVDINLICSVPYHKPCLHYAVFLTMDKEFSYTQPHLLISVVTSHSFIVLVRMFLFIPPSWSAPAVFSLSRWKVPGFSFRSSMCFKLIVCRLEDLNLSVSLFFTVIQQFSHHQKLRRWVYALSTFVGNPMAVAGWVGSWVLYYFCWSMSVFVCVSLVLL